MAFDSGRDLPGRLQGGIWKRHGGKNQRHEEEILGKGQVDQVGQRQEGRQVTNAASVAHDCDEDTPRDYGEVDLLSPPGPASFLGKNFEGVVIDGCVSQPANSICKEPVVLHGSKIRGG